MSQVSKTIGVKGQYIYLPNLMFISFSDAATHTTETHFIRQSQGFDMHRLSEIYRLEKLVAHGEVSVDEALEYIDKVAEQNEYYRKYFILATYGLQSFSAAAMFYGGSWQDAGLAAGLGRKFSLSHHFYSLFGHL